MYGGGNNEEIFREVKMGCSIPVVRAFAPTLITGHSISAVRTLRVREGWVQFPMPRKNECGGKGA
ncbi:MAG: hypothetical protein UX23_C0002G0054 [Parcubacteria group bacterium GW2011_GWB1_45_9]|nr:MAG: hypothetical protein UX23_C0002G0054 [Parcubacteria group bacterium GW2011_GWB1_45_9]